MSHWTHEDRTLQSQMYRKRHMDGVSLRELGRLLGISFSSLARFERGVGRLGNRSRLLVQAWLDGKEWQSIAAKPPTVSARMEQEIHQIVDQRMQQWVRYLEEKGFPVDSIATDGQKDM